VVCYVTGNHSTERPIPSPQDVANKLNILFSNPQLREEYGQRAYEYVQGLSWSSAVDKWDDLLKSIVNPFSVEVIPEKIC